MITCGPSETSMFANGVAPVSACPSSNTFAHGSALIDSDPIGSDTFARTALFAGTSTGNVTAIPIAAFDSSRSWWPAGIMIRSALVIPSRLPASRT